jgi:hypothetical protein
MRGVLLIHDEGINKKRLGVLVKVMLHRESADQAGMKKRQRAPCSR